MEQRPAPHSGGEDFEFTDQNLLHDLHAPELLLRRESLRLMGTRTYHMALEISQLAAEGVNTQYLASELTYAMEQMAYVTILDREKQRHFRLDARERTFLTDFLGLSDHIPNQLIRETYYRRLHYLSLLRYAGSFGLTIAEATDDVQAGRAPSLAEVANIDNPKRLTELRRQIAEGNNPEFTQG